MNNHLYFLIYFSKATRLMTQQELSQLLHQARTFNQAHGLTGMLVYMEGIFLAKMEGRFMQVLEGTEENVRSVFEKIKLDDRHHRVIELKQGLLNKRHFHDWQMGFESLNLGPELEIEGYFKLDDNVFATEDFAKSNVALSFLKSFHDTHQNLNQRL